MTRYISVGSHDDEEIRFQPPLPSELELLLLQGLPGLTLQFLGDSIVYILSQLLKSDFFQLQILSL